MKDLKIDNKVINENSPTFIIAEVSQSHEGSLGIAHSFIDAASESGADAIKFQVHIADSESTLDEKFRINFSFEDKSRYDYWKRMEFTEEQWQGLMRHAKEKNLHFICSVFSLEAFEMMQKLGISSWKVASGEIYNQHLIEHMCKSGLPILCSTGMSNYKEIDEIVEKFKYHNSPFSLFQCTTSYPNPLNQVGLNVISEFKKRYECLVGLSDHSGTVFPAYSAISKGINFLELHVTFHKRLFGPDVSSSVTFDELRAISQMRDAEFIMTSNPIDKDSLAESLKQLKVLFGRSIAFNREMVKDEIIKAENIVLKKPGDGIKIDDIEKIIGRKLTKTVSLNRLLRWNDLD